MKKIITLTLFLAIISALAGATLAFVNDMTSPIIEERKIAAVKATLEAIFPGASEYKEISFEDASGDVTNVYEAAGSGYAFNVSVQGYKDVITFIVGIDESGKIVGFTINYVNDTPGLGTKVADPEFASQIIGKQVGDKVDTIAGSTVSSAAVVKGIDAAVAVYQSLK
jgi:Na+-translocating ferredoxin:NAD+ oxidoreductase subunit G